jgi:fatty-acyl-CoA synthase
MSARKRERPRSRHYADLLDEMAERQPQALAVIHDRRRLTYAQLRHRSREVARGLYALGVRPGDRVALLMSNRLEWPVVAFAVFQLGATLVPISTWYRAWDLAHVLGHCQAKVLITMEAFRGNRYLDTLLQLAPELARQRPDRVRLEHFPDLERVVVVGAETAPDWAIGFGAMLESARGVDEADLASCRRRASDQDLCYILYTSGSTSTPKGVMVQHWGCLVNGFDIGERQHLTERDRLWLVVPLAWALGSQNGMSAILTHGGCMVVQRRSR